MGSLKLNYMEISLSYSIRNRGVCGRVFYFNSFQLILYQFIISVHISFYNSRFSTSAGKVKYSLLMALGKAGVHLCGSSHHHTTTTISTGNPFMCANPKLTPTMAIIYNLAHAQTTPGNKLSTQTTNPPNGLEVLIQHTRGSFLECYLNYIPSEIQYHL